MAPTGQSMKHLTFLSHFCLCLAVAAGSFFAWQMGVLEVVWRNDKSMMTSAIGVLLVGTLAWLGRQAWLVGADGRWVTRPGNRPKVVMPPVPDASFGHLAERLAVIIGIVGTVVGLAMQSKALAGGSASFEALATSLFTTACGGTAAAIIAVATFNLERGIKNR
jgi:hypothetical protein